MLKDQAWQIQTLELLKLAAEKLSEPELKTYGIEMIRSAIEKAPNFIKDGEDLQNFRLHTLSLIGLIPKTQIDKAQVTAYKKAFSTYKGLLLSKYELIPNGYYIAVWMPLGIAIGTSFGVALKNIGLGISLGVAIGVAIGAGLNAKAEKEGRVL